MLRSSLSAVLAGFCCLAAATLVACDGPCESLAEKICSCEPNEVEKRGCLEQVRVAMQRAATTAETNACSEALDTCDCEVLEREEYRLCGLSKEGG